MPQKISPALDVKYGWDLGEGGWNSGMDENLLKFSQLFDANIDGVVSELPPVSPQQAYFLTTDKRVYFSVEGSYRSTPVPKWFVLKNRSNGDTYRYNGESLVQVPNNVQLATSVATLDSSISSMGTAAYRPEEYFVSQSQLDLSEASQAAYTDSLRNDITGEAGAGLIPFNEALPYPAGSSGSAIKDIISSLADVEGSADLGVRVEKARKTLRRAVNSIRHDPAQENRRLAYDVMNACKKTNTDAGITVWEPDGVGSYGSAWTRDQSMSMEGYLDYFGADEIEDVATYFLSKSNVALGHVPDHIAHNGTVYWTPGSTNDWGSRAPVDGNTYLLQMFWLHYVKTGNASLYQSNSIALKNLIENGIPYNPTTNCVTIDNSNPFVGFGFYDTVKMTGDVLFPSILAYRAFLQLSDMEFSLGNFTEAERLINRAEQVRAGINANLLNYYDVDSSFNAIRKLGFYKASTGKCSGQLDMWGTLFAVWSDIPYSGWDKMIASNVFGITTAEDADPTLSTVHDGAVRHVVIGTDFSEGVASWEDYYISVPFGTYQNGGYWHTATPWLCHTLSIIDPSEAQDHYGRMLASFASQSSSVKPVEWFTLSGTLGVGKYCTTAIAPLQCGELMPFYEVSAPVGDILSTLTQTGISVTGEVTLNGTSFGKMHTCSGATNYTVVLPSVSGNAGKMLGIRMSGDLTGLVTVDGAGSETIDGQVTRVMWAGEVAILLCDGSSWTKVAGKSLPMSCVMRRTTAQSVSLGSWTKVSMSSVARDNTSSLVSPCTDTTNGNFVARRPGLYQVSGFCSFTGLTTGQEVNIGASLNSPTPNDNPNAFITIPAPSTGIVQGSGSGVFQCVSGDTLMTTVFAAGASGTVDTRNIASVYPTLSVTEIVTW